MKASKVSVSNFAGLQTSVDRASVPPNVAVSGTNYLCLDGTLKPRYGYHNLAPTTSPFFDGVKGFAYVSGYDSSNVEQEEYITFEKRTGVATLMPYRLETATWSRAEIKNGATSLTLTNSDWYVVVCKAVAYCFNDTDGMYKHDVGTTNTFNPMSFPVPPAAKLGWARVTNGQIDMTGIDPSSGAEVAVVAPASNTNSSYAAPIILIRHTTATGTASIEIDFDGTTAGKRDWYWNDAFSFVMQASNGTYMDFSPNSIKVTLTSDGADTVTGTVYTKRTGGTTTEVLVWWDQGKTRTDWGDGAGTGHTEKLKIEYTITKNASGGTGNANSEIRFVFGALSSLGWTRTLPANVSSLTNQVLEVAHTYYNSTTGFESDLSPIAEIPYNEFYLPDPDSVSMWDVGTRMNLTFASTLAVDKVRIYVKDLNGYWRRVTTVNDTSTPYVFYTPYDDLISLDAYEGRRFETVRKVCCATEFRGSIVWGYKGGFQNIRYSRTDNAEAQSSPYDELDDDARGANYSLAENFDDEPQALWGIGDCLLALGEKGAYWQTGDKPSNMSPLARIPGSSGVAGRRASCKWPHGVAYLTPAGDVRSVNGNISGFSDEEVSGGIRGFIKAFLGDETGVSLSYVNAVYDERTDALWFINGNRAVVLRQPNIMDGKRHWHAHEYTPTISYATGTPKRGILWIRSTGEIDEADWNTTTGAYVEGVNRDGGSKMPDGTWRGGSIGTMNGRTRLGGLEADYQGAAVFHVYSDRQTSGPLVLNLGRRHARCDAFQQGWNHYAEVAVTEDLTELRSFNFELIPMSAGVNR